MKLAKVEVEVLADSISSQGCRITTLSLKYPRYIHSEFMTHRMFSRNASSSRAIPVSKMLRNIWNNFVTPIHWGKNQAGMQAKDENLKGVRLWLAKAIWYGMAVNNSLGVWILSKLGLHKQWANRPTEWFSQISVVVTATDWDNFFALRCHPDAQPEIRNLAEKIRDALQTSKPKLTNIHLPYYSDSTYEGHSPLKVMGFLGKDSAACCARVTHLNHDGSFASPDDNARLYDKLVGSKPEHYSPLEHQAIACEDSEYCANLRGWKSQRTLHEEGKIC